MKKNARQSGVIPQEKQPILELMSLTKVYRSISRQGIRPCVKGVVALNDNNATFKGGVLGLVGPNGAGKTTMIRLIAGILKSTSGSISVLGYDPWKSSPKMKRRVGFLMDQPEYPSISGERYLNYIGELRGLTRAKARDQTVELLETVELTDAGSRSINGYSAGMRRRLGIAIAFVANPEFIVMDEPTKSLDPNGRRILMALVRTQHKEKGTHFLISSHILTDLERMCSEAWILSEGKILAKGSMAELTTLYAPRRFVIEVDRPEILLDHLKKSPSVESAEIEGHRIIVSGDQKEVSMVVSKLIPTLGLVMYKFEPAVSELERVVFGGESDDSSK